jgi:hypothetical protein
LRFDGKIKAITFKGERASVLLEGARIFKEGQQVWEDYTDERLVKTGKYAKGEVWMSTFESSNAAGYQACKELEKMGKGVGVDVSVVENKGFLNIAGIGLNLKEVDVNADLEPPDDHEKQAELTEEPSSTQRPKDSPEAQATKLVETTGDIVAEIEATAKDVLIVRQTCIKAAGFVVEDHNNISDKTREEKVVALAKRLETFVLTGK